MLQAADPVGFGIVTQWIGLITGIVGIVLSVVAGVFAILVNARATQVNDQMIQALQKISGDVEHLSEDTRELIKAGWDKLLGSVDRPPTEGASSTSAEQDKPQTRELAAGIAAELKEELTALTAGRPPAGPDTVKYQEELDKILKSLEASLASQFAVQRTAARPGQALDRILNTLTHLSPEAQALLMEVRWSHIELEEYKKLAEGRYRSALLELREAGFVVPVKHTHEGRAIPCYYFPPSIASLLRAAIPLLPRIPDEVVEAVRTELVRVGYDPSPPRDVHKPRGHR